MKLRSYLLLFILTLLLFFVLGVRYGQKVEKTNKAINNILSVTPIKTQSPTPPTTIGFQTLIHKGCGIKLIYPVQYVVEESTFSATLKQQSIEQISFKCESGLEIDKIFTTLDIATTEVVFKNNKMTIKVSEDAHNKTVYVMKLLNPVNGKTILFSFTKELYLLIESGLQFISSS